jgi:hypothetical protein
MSLFEIHESAMTESPTILDIMRDRVIALGVSDYDSAVPHMLVELFYRHATDILKEAQKIVRHHGVEEMGEADIRSAFGVVSQQGLLAGLSAELVKEVSLKINRVPLPTDVEISEMILPCEETTLMEPNFRLRGHQ